MGRRGKSSTLGHMTGKIGTVILKNWKGVDVVQSLPHWKTKKRICTDTQVVNQDLFKSVNAFLRPAIRAINLGFQQSKKAKMTPLNAASSFHLQNAVARTNESWSVHFSQVKFSRPIHQIDNGWNIEFGVDEESQLEVTWELNPFPEKTTLQTDFAVIVYHSQRYGKLYLTDYTPRKLLGCKLPKVFTRASDEVNCWVYFVSDDHKRVSLTKYLGNITIQV